MSNIRHLVGSICRWVCANSMLIRGLFPDLHLIFCGGENEMPDCKDISPQSGLDCADRKTPGKEQAGGGLFICLLAKGRQPYRSIE